MVYKRHATHHMKYVNVVHISHYKSCVNNCQHFFTKLLNLFPKCDKIRKNGVFPMLKLYENIRDLRKSNHWTQEDLASRMGYTDRSMIAKIESGKVDLSQSKIIEFARVFGVDPGDLMGWDAGIEQNVNIEMGETNQALRLFEMYSNASPEVRVAVDLLLKSSQPDS